MCYIESPTWITRTGRPGERQPVRVYSNCPRVKLFVNGETCSERQRAGTAFPAAGLVWHVLFHLGRNELRAVGVTTDGQRVEHIIALEYHKAATGPGVAFRWQIQPADGEAGIQVTIQLVDADGRPVVEDRRRVFFSLRGGGALRDCLGIAGGSRVIELINGRASMVVLPAGETVLQVAVEGLPDTLIAL